jgi:threonine synthase
VRRVDGRDVAPTRTVVLDPETAAKVEAEGVAGSHKWRHLFGTLLALPEADRRPLAIASCGNAALAAATLARAAERHLDVFVPDWADRPVLARLAALGAEVTVSSREPGERGDPCLRQFRAAVQRGSVPFSCQGTDNAMALDGGRTLGWELADQLGGRAPDHVVLQAGGGALASCGVRALEEATRLGALDAMPRVHVVQAEGAAPLVRAWQRMARVASGLGWEAACAEGAKHPAEFMWPWAHPHSVATGILDDETYDWLDIVGGVARSGGSIFPVTDDEMVAAAGKASATTGTPIGPTGAAGYAGVDALRRTGLTGTFAVVLTGGT